MDDKQWDDYVRRQPGTFWGEYGRQNDELRRNSMTPTPQPAPRSRKPAASPSKPTRAGGRSSGGASEGDWSTGWAILGMLLGSGYALARPNPEPGLVLFAAILAGFLLGRFHKAVLILVVIGLVLAVLAQ